MTDPVNQQDFPLAATMFLFGTLSAMGSSGQILFVDDDGPVPFPPNGILGYCSETTSQEIGGLDDRRYDSAGADTTQTTIYLSLVTVRVRVESMNSSKQARNVLENLRVQLQSDAAGQELRSRNTAYQDCSNITRVPTMYDNRAAFVAVMDVKIAWTSTLQAVDTGAINHGSVTGTLEYSGNNGTVTDKATF